MGKKFFMPKMIDLDVFVKDHPEFQQRGVVALFPTLVERDREEKREWLHSVLVEGRNGSTKSTWDYITFCTSGDAMIIMKSEEAAKALVSRSPLYKVGTEVIFEPWTSNLRVRLQYRGAYNRVVEMEEVEL